VIELLLLPIGIGAGLTVPPLTTAFMDDIRPGQAGIGAGVLNSSRQLGSALGVAVCGALLDANFATGLRLSFLISGATVLAAAVLILRYLRPGLAQPLG
jgi:DHA2 family methylenomycin A resistance protein-like MFS transporter